MIMRWFAIKIIFLLSLAIFVSYSIGEGATRIVVVGDTGTGERAYAPGFMAVQKAMRKQNADALLHLGDFVYQPEFFPTSCPDRYVKEIKETLSNPYPIKLFVAGDNDLPPKNGNRKLQDVGTKSILSTPDSTHPDLVQWKGRG